MFPSKRHPSGHIPGDLLGEWLREAQRQAKLPKLLGRLWHPYRRGWASERMYFPLKAVAARHRLLISQSIIMKV